MQEKNAENKKNLPHAKNSKTFQLNWPRRKDREKRFLAAIRHIKLLLNGFTGRKVQLRRPHTYSAAMPSRSLTMMARLDAPISYLAQPRRSSTNKHRDTNHMIPPVTQDHLLTLAEVVALLLAHRLTPEPLRSVLLDFTSKLKETLPADSMKDVQAAEAKAVICALAYRRED